VAQASLEKAAYAQHERAVASREQVRALPAIRARREKAKGRVKRVEADCQQLRGQAEALRLELDAPHKNSEKAEELEERVRRLERECRDLHEGFNAAQTAEPSAGGMSSDGELAQSKVQNEHLLAEVREVRQARDEAAAEESKLSREIVELQQQLSDFEDELISLGVICPEKEHPKFATDVWLQAKPILESIAELNSEALGERQAMAEQDALLLSLKKERANLRLQTEKVHEVIAEKKAQLVTAEESESATALELEKKCAQLKEENPHGVMSRCLNAARFKAKSDRALWPASQANVC